MKKKQRISKYVKSNNEFKHKNYNLNGYLKSLKESFKFIKENWVMVSSLLVICLCITLIRAYSVVFSGNIGAAAEYVQYYITGNIYKLIAFISIPFGIIVATVIIPMCVSTVLIRDSKYGKLEERSRDISTRRVSVIKTLIWHALLIWLINFLITLSINFSLLYFLVVENKYLFWIFKQSLIISLSSLLISFIMIIVCTSVGDKIKLKVCMLISTFVMLVVINFSGDFVDVINWDGSGYASCIKDRTNSGDKGVTALPISYDTRGVQVFTGEYDSHVKKWKNDGSNVVHREYLQFDRGYKVIPGECSE